jgi:hypothetical protein
MCILVIEFKIFIIEIEITIIEANSISKDSTVDQNVFLIFNNSFDEKIYTIECLTVLKC